MVVLRVMVNVVPETVTEEISSEAAPNTAEVAKSANAHNRIYVNVFFIIYYFSARYHLFRRDAAPTSLHENFGAR